MSFTLYHHGSSVCAAKVRFAMDIKGLEWDGEYIDILKGEQFTPEYTKLNPKAVVPTLVHDDNVIVDSTVIIEYLDQIEPGTSVHPTDPVERAAARQWTKAVDEDLHPACGAVTFVCSHRHTVLKNLGPEGLKKFLASTPPMSVTSDWKSLKDSYTRFGFEAPGAEEKVKLYDSYLHKMEEALKGGNEWLVGNKFSIADISLTPYVNRLAMLSMRGMWENGRLPNVDAWFRRLEAMPSFDRAFNQWLPDHLRNDLRETVPKAGLKSRVFLKLKLEDKERSMGRLEGKTAVVTGAAQGIGAVMAKSLAEHGAKVLVTDIQDTAAAVKAINDAGGTAVGLHVDVTKNEDLAAMVEKAKSEFGGLDIMVNNASIFATLTPKPFFEISDDEFDTIMRVNARSVHQSMKAILPTMVAAGGGKVINIASGTFYYGPPGLSHYTASKAAVIALTRGHARELGDKNIQINAIAPGLTESEGLRGNTGFDMARAPTVGSRSIKREMVPEDLLGTLIYLASDDSNFVTGQTLNVDGGKINL